MGFPGSSAGKESACNAEDLGLISGLGRFPGGEHGNPFWYSCLENLHGQRRLAGYSPWGCKEFGKTELLSTAHAHTHTHTHTHTNIYICVGGSFLSLPPIHHLHPIPLGHLITEHHSGLPVLRAGKYNKKGKEKKNNNQTKKTKSPSTGLEQNEKDRGGEKSIK